MDRATIERNLAQVERDMRAASEDIAHQRQTSRNLVRHGQDDFAMSSKCPLQARKPTLFTSSAMSQRGRFCCRSRLRPWANGDSVSAGRFSAEARDDGAAQPGSRATFLLVLPC